MISRINLYTSTKLIDSCAWTKFCARVPELLMCAAHLVVGVLGATFSSSPTPTPSGGVSTVAVVGTTLVHPASPPKPFLVSESVSVVLVSAGLAS